MTKLVVLNGSFWTDTSPSARAVAIEAGRITAVGSIEEARDAAGPRAEEIDLAGGAVLPGLVDSHAHLLNWGRGQLGVRCWPGEVSSIADISARVRKAAATAPPGACIRGRGFDPGQLAERRAPTAAELDPGGEWLVVLDSMDFHRRVVSPAVLRRAGIGRDTPDPVGGVIVRDADGYPTGELLDAARALVDSAIPPWSEAENEQALQAAAEHFLSRGFTRVTNAAPLTMAATGEEISALGRLADRGELAIWVRSMLKAELAGSVRALGLPERLSYERLTIAGLKVFADGAFGPRTAWLSEPYSDGTEIAPAQDVMDHLRDTIDDAASSGWQICVHAIGDRAISAAAGWLPRTSRVHHRIEHCCLTEASAIRCMADAGIVPVPQMSFLRERADTFLDALGDARMHRLYPLREWIDAGLHPLHGSDAPVTRDIRPLPALATAIHRRDMSGRPWGRDQSISASEALCMATLWPALADGESDRGRIAVGCRAELSVFDHDPRTLPPEDWGEIQAVMTIVDGQAVWSR